MIGFAGMTGPVAIADAQAGAPAAPLQVVELFQSQGCSSCPPANANVIALARRSDILALSWQVTYWDYLGWKDSFAQPAFTERQRRYAQALGHGSVWTPQVVINGAGAAGISCAKMFLNAGVKRQNLILCDRHGVLRRDRLEGLSPEKQDFAIDTELETLADALSDR